MNYVVLLFFVSALCALSQGTVTDTKPGVSTAGPPTETLRYSVNWPSGLSLGEATLSSSASEAVYTLSFALDASIPGLVIQERASAKATPNYCSLELQKSFVRGNRKANETTTFDLEARKVTRKTKDGGSSEVSTSQCARDAITYLYFLRRELAAGRLPLDQKVYYGHGYDVHVQFAGVQKVPLESELVEAERVLLTIKGASSENTAEILFAKDPKRTPLIIRVPFVLGKFSMELQR
ncbi:MAG TPA: DUF3108 domain-containing protein [Bryobacteraceae bacterium]|jgi:hypothetical protein|nr:DUF3108 domain-containing protein [Bryobacteraceae bacterium]